MKLYSDKFAKLLYFWPGRRYGFYRYLPIFFAVGAALEFTMIHLDVRGQVNFYRTYKRRQAREIAEVLFNSQSPETESK